ncbi:MAG: hypothetical protein MUC51_16935 [Anaerolineae bacterium]|nr:hypothetical protein [Anaerolineae bacterium]
MNAFYTNRMVGKATILALALMLAAGGLNASAAAGNPGVYTLDADFDQGTLVNVNHNAPDNNQLQLDSEATPFDFIWVAASARGTVVRIDTQNGAILGEYLSAPDGRARNPSRTTVDGNGNVWTANRDESAGNSGSALKIGLLENGQCVDRNGDGDIDTSTGLGDIKPWPNIGGADDGGGVTTAEDECILVYQRLPNAPNARHVSVDGSNNVWVGGYPYFPTTFHKLNGVTGAIMASFAPDCGGYGGLIDGSNVLWSAAISQNQLLRYDLATNTGTCISVAQSYGLGIDVNGYIWNAMWGNNTVAKISPAGAIQPGFPVLTGGSASRGVVVTASDNHIWIANSYSNDVSRLDNNGVLQATVPVGNQPTGVAVDRAGKVWVTNLGSDNAMRIDPATNGVDMTVSLGPGAGPYNYSDMTGSTLIAPPNTGTWTVVHDSGILDAIWGLVTWNADTPGDSSLQVYAASSTDGVTFSAEESVTDGADLSVPDGQYLRVRVQFNRASTGESPILYDLTILANRPPDCGNAAPSVSMLWPPNHKWVPVSVGGVTDPDGDAVTILFTSIRQDEPVDTYGDGRYTPDGMGVGEGTVQLRAERAGTAKVPGNGRVYTLTFTATDPYGLTCDGTVQVGVPHNVGRPPIDDGPNYDSTALTP